MWKLTGIVLKNLIVSSYFVIGKIHEDGRMVAVTGVTTDESSLGLTDMIRSSAGSHRMTCGSWTTRNKYRYKCFGQCGQRRKQIETFQYKVLVDSG